VIEVLELAKRFKKLVAVDGVSFTCHDGEVFGLLVERAGLYARFTPREHLHFYGRLHGLDGPKLEQRVSTVLEMLEIADFADRRAEGFSAGMNTTRPTSSSG
jgi:sodium transport system ATP-binding protein